MTSRRRKNMNRIIDLSKDRIDEVICKASGAEDAVLGLYKLCFSDDEWDACSMVDGYPEVSVATAERILDGLQTEFTDERGFIMMMWLDKGFSVREDVEDWKINLRNVELRA